MTLDKHISAIRGPTSGFDYLRVTLAVAVLAWHTLPLTQGEEIASQFMAGWCGALVRLVLPMFFALSGFLVAASLERNTLGTFLAFRALRIAPALAVEIALSALILGPLLTSFALHDYFSDGKFPRYFLNAVGWIHYQLPGMFLSNPYPDVVNGSLWTVPFELECYLALVVLAFVGIMHRPIALLAVIMVGAAALIAVAFFRHDAAPRIDAAVSGRTLILCFLAGAMVYAARGFLPYSGKLCAACVVASLVMLSVPSLYVFSPVPAAYATVWIGLQNFRKVPFLFRGDYSYGVYLYAFPIQQTTVELMPHAGFVATMLFSLTGAACFAVFSWHAIERPTLRLKKLFPIDWAKARAWLDRRFPMRDTSEDIW